MLRLAFDFIITWRETRTRPNAYLYRVPEHLREHHQEYKQKDSYAKIPYTCPHLFLRIASRI